MDGAEVSEMIKTLGFIIGCVVVLFVVVPISRQFTGDE